MIVETPKYFIEVTIPVLLACRFEKKVHIQFITNNVDTFFLKDALKTQNPQVTVTQQIGLKTTNQPFFFETVAEDVVVLVVLYAGLYDIGRILEYALSIKASRKKAVVYILTCSCDKMKKEIALQKASEQGELEGVVYTENCGGAYDFVQIYKAIIKTLK